MLSAVSSRRLGVVPRNGISPHRRFAHVRQRRRGHCLFPLNATPPKSVAAKIEQQEKANRTPVLDALDIVSFTGTITGAALVVLGYDIMFAALPIGFPLATLFVGIHRERRRNQARTEFDEMLMDDITRQKEALDHVQAEIATLSAKIEQLSHGKIKSFEDKLDRIEGTLLSTSKNIRQISSGIRDLPGIIKRMSDLQQQTVIYAVSNEFRSLFEKWGTTQLQSISEVANRMKFVEDSIEEMLTSGPPPTDDNASTPIDVFAERKDSSIGTGSILGKMKDVIDKDVASILKQLKDNQVDMMQTLRDVKINPVPQVDYSFLEKQLERIEDVLDELPRQLSDTMKSEATGASLKETFYKQFSAISSVVGNLESAIQELRNASKESDSSAALELDGMEKKWQELQSMMHSLSDQMTGVSERMETMTQQSEQSELQFEEEKFEAVTETDSVESDRSYLEFPDKSSADLAKSAVDSSPEEPEWDVVNDTEDGVYDSVYREVEQDAFEEREEEAATVETALYSQNGTHGGDIPPVEASFPATDTVSMVGNPTVGLEYLKQGRLAIQEDYGEASRLLANALEQFESILEVDPTNIQSLGNCGNTLLALGELKRDMAKEIDNEKAGTKEHDPTNARKELEEEAQQFLTLAGRRFKTLLENRPDDKRAYVNWGKALCIRARLTGDVAMKMQLYDAAIVKYEQVLSFEPTSADAMLCCGIALKESSQIQFGSPMELRNRLSQATAYFESVGRLVPSSSAQFEAFQMRQECQELLGSPTLI